MLSTISCTASFVSCFFMYLFLSIHSVIEEYINLRIYLLMYLSLSFISALIQGTCHPSHWPKLWLKPVKLMDFDQLQRIHLKKVSRTICANRQLKSYPLCCFCFIQKYHPRKKKWDVLDSQWLYKTGYITLLKSGNLSVAFLHIVGFSDLPHPWWHLTRARDQGLPRVGDSFRLKLLLQCLGTPWGGFCYILLPAFAARAFCNVLKKHPWLLPILLANPSHLAFRLVEQNWRQTGQQTCHWGRPGGYVTGGRWIPWAGRALPRKRQWMLLESKGWHKEGSEDHLLWIDTYPGFFVVEAILYPVWIWTVSRTVWHTLHSSWSGGRNWENPVMTKHKTH